MERMHRLRILCLVAGAVLFACAKDHTGSMPVTEPVAGAAAEGGQAGAPAKPPVQPKPGKAGVPGTKAVGKFQPVGEAAKDPDAALRGAATFTVTEKGVDLAILVRQCARSGGFDVFIQEGGDCSDATLSGPHWDRGEGIPKVSCLGVSGQGRGSFSRSSADDKRWSIGGSDAADILGHAIVAYDVSSGAPIACGVIGQDESAPAPTVPDPDILSSVPMLGRAQIAGLCFGDSIVRDNEQQCPDPKLLTACAEEHCQLDSCVAMCGDYLACTTKEEDPCSVAFTCDIDGPCAECQAAVQQCVFNFCTDQITCAAPVAPDGPCTKLEACCGLQGDMAGSCLETVRLVEKLSGDPSCYGLMHDWDFFSHLPVPCTFE
jgi:hypothetical protein